MKNQYQLCLWLALVVLTGCVTERSYYLTPLNTNSNHYHNIPLHTDSFKAATYVHFTFTGGGANDALRDNLFAFHGNLHQAHNFGNFQAYYGVGFTLGSYEISEYTDPYSFDNPDTLIHIPHSYKFFGSYGFNGGINAVIPFANKKGEWRVIGFEASLQNEFGDFLKFRKSLPDSAINILDKNRLTTTIGLTTEIIGKTRHGTSFGYKIAIGKPLISGKKYLGNESNNLPAYFSQTLHITKGRWTGFGQLNAGLHTASFQCGINYRLGRKKTIQ